MLKIDYCVFRATKQQELSLQGGTELYEIL